MTSFYTCASCRRLLGKVRRIRKLQWDSRASFISFNQPRPSHKGATTTDRGDERTISQRKSGKSRATKASVPRQNQCPPARNSRDDVLVNLFLSPGDMTSNSVHKGRYSAPRERSGATSKDGTLTSGALDIDPARNDPNPVESWPPFRRLAKVSRTPITTLRRQRVRRGEPIGKHE